MDEFPVVPGIVYESEMHRQEKRDARQFWFDVILVILLLLTNAFWVIRELSYEDVITTTTSTQIEASQDGNGNNYAVGGDIVGAESKNSDFYDHNQNP